AGLPCTTTMGIRWTELIVGAWLLDFEDTERDRSPPSSHPFPILSSQVCFSSPFSFNKFCSIFSSPSLSSSHSPTFPSSVLIGPFHENSSTPRLWPQNNLDSVGVRSTIFEAREI